MKAIEEVLNGWADYEKIREFLKKEKGIIQISGCVDAGKAHMVYGVGNGFGKKIIATFSEQKARELYEDCRFFDANTVYYPAKDILFYQSDLRGNQTDQRADECHEGVVRRRADDFSYDI